MSPGLFHLYAEYIMRNAGLGEPPSIVGKGTRDQIANIRRIMEKGREFQKNNYFCFIDYAKAFDFGIIVNCGSQ